MFHAVKQSVRKKQKPVWPATEKPSPDDPIDCHAFRNYHPNSEIIRRSGSPKVRQPNLITGETESPMPQYVLEMAAYKAERRAIETNRNAILSAGDVDQITLALKGVLDDPKIRPYYNRIVGEKNTEAARLGLEAIEGIRKIVDICVENRESGGRSKECRSLLKNIIMAMLKKNPGHGIKSAIRRQVLTSLSNDAAWRLLQSSGEKRKRFEEMNMQDFRAVEEEADRLKFPDKEIDDLQSYMCDNLYTRDSPNERDTLRKRDIHGKPY